MRVPSVVQQTHSLTDFYTSAVHFLIHALSLNLRLLRGKLTSLLVFYIFHKHTQRLRQLLLCNTVSHVPVLFYHAIKLTTMGKL